MKSCLVIEELSYFHEVNGIDVMGGRDVAATTGTIATAEPGSTSAGAFAYAEGEYTEIQTKISAVSGPNVNLAGAEAKAYAKTGSNTAKSLSISNSISATRRLSSSSKSNSISLNLTIQT
jgi:hypothetical protein